MKTYREVRGEVTGFVLCRLVVLVREGLISSRKAAIAMNQVSEDTMFCASVSAEARRMAWKSGGWRSVE